MNNISQLLGYALIPAATMSLAGFWAVWRAPGENMRSALMHFAAGVVFAVLAVEFLPDLVHEHSALATGVGFALGAAAMLVIRAWNAKRTENEIDGTNTVSGSLIAATAVDIAVDGVMLGIGFAAGAKQGVLLTIALGFELISLGLAVALELQQGRMPLRRIGWNIISLSALFIFTAVLGTFGLSFISGILRVGVIAFGAAALLFLVTEELLDEAHEVPETPLLTSMFFVGFLVILLMELLS